ncbi:hypothetical protein Tco_0530062 [Tanacetum coccineum]
MLNEIKSLKAQLRSKVSCFTSDSVKPKVLAPGMYVIYVKPIQIPLRTMELHLNYISHLKESVEIVREIVIEDAEYRFGDQKAKLSDKHSLNRIRGFGKAVGKTILRLLVCQVILLVSDSADSKNMTRNRFKAKNFGKKFIGTVSSRMIHFGAIMVMEIMFLVTGDLKRLLKVASMLCLGAVSIRTLSKVRTPKNFKMAVIDGLLVSSKQDVIQDLSLEVSCKGISQEEAFDFEELFAQLHENIEATSARGFDDQDNPSHIYCLMKFSLWAKASIKGVMSMMGQMSFFLGLQVSQSPRGIFINQAKYALETLKKYGIDLSDPVDTPMVDRLKLECGSNLALSIKTHRHRHPLLPESKWKIVLVVETLLHGIRSINLATFHKSSYKRKRFGNFFSHDWAWKSFDPKTLRRRQEGEDE